MQVLFYLEALLEGCQGHLLILSVLTERKKKKKGIFENITFSFIIRELGFVTHRV